MDLETELELDVKVNSTISATAPRHPIKPLPPEMTIWSHEHTPHERYADVDDDEGEVHSSEYVRQGFHQHHARMVDVDVASLIKEFTARVEISSSLPGRRRLEFWTTPSVTPSWFLNQTSTHMTHPFTQYELRESAQCLDNHSRLPPNDLLILLLDAFFEHVHILHPLLHQGLFRSQLRDGLQYRDSRFMSLVLVVCACGSRFVDDERVLSEPSQPQSSGWCYFDQLGTKLRFGVGSPPTLFDMQREAVSNSASMSWCSC